MSRRLAGALVVPAIAYLAALYAFPVVETLRLSFGSSEALARFGEIASARTTWIVFRQTLEMAIVVTAICVAIGYPIAYLLVVLPERPRRVLIVLVLLPYWISTLVRSYAWIAILGRNGAINWMSAALGLTSDPLQLVYNRFGATIGMVNVVAPIMILVLYAGFSGIDRRLVRVGSVLGGRPFFVFGRVFLPLSLPAVGSGCILVFLISLGVFTTPAILGGSTETSVAMAIEQQVGTLLDLPAAAALSTLLLAVTLAILVLTQRYWVAALLGRPGSSVPRDIPRWFGAIVDGVERIAPRAAVAPLPQIEAAGGASSCWNESRTASRRLLWCACALGLLYLLAPVIVVIGLSFSSASFLQFPPRGLSLRWFEQFFGSREWLGATARSFIVASITTLLATVLGFATAYGMERGALRYKPLLYILFLSPLVVPPAILAFGLYYLYAKAGLIGSMPALAAAHVVIVMPFVLVTLCQGLRTIDPAIEFAAGSLGARPFYAFRRITLPLLRNAAISGALLGFLTSFDELVIALFLTSPRSATLPKRMWDSVRFEIDPTNAAAATLLIALSVILVSLSLVAATGPGRARPAPAAEEP